MDGGVLKSVLKITKFYTAKNIADILMEN